MDAIENCLAGMGETPDQVANALRAAGIVGRLDSTSFENPVVRYLNRSLVIGGRLEVGASGERLFLYRDGSAVSLSLPGPVREFLPAFHRGEYPDLVQTKSGK